MPSPGPEKRVSDVEILAAVLQAPHPVVTAGDVGDAVGISRQGADKRLRQLEDDDLVQSTKKGSRLWWLTDGGLARVGTAAAHSDDNAASGE